MTLNFENNKIIPEAMKEFENQVMLHINKRLYEKGLINKEMFTHAKETLLKS